MVNRIIFWTGFGAATRMLSLGIEMRPLFNKGSLWVYPIYMGIGGSFGYWMQNIDERQRAVLSKRRQALIEKRERKTARDEARNAEKAAATA